MDVLLATAAISALLGAWIGVGYERPKRRAAERYLRDALLRSDYWMGRALDAEAQALGVVREAK